jgi:hypothetical protein
MKCVFGTDNYFPKCATHSKAFKDVTATEIPQSTVYEVNAACLKHATMTKLLPDTKHIGIPWHWYR